MLFTINIYYVYKRGIPPYSLFFLDKSKPLQAHGTLNITCLEFPHNNIITIELGYQANNLESAIETK